MKLIIQIPCYNEEKTLPDVIRDLPKELPGVAEIEYLVIDDGSTDNTAQVARELGVHYILSLGNKNRGLAVAFMAGINKCLELGADIIVNTDGDNQYNADCIDALISPILTSQADVVIGTRPIDKIEYFSGTKKFLQHFGSRVVRHFSGADIPDAASGFRAYSQKAAMSLQVFNGYDYALESIIHMGHMNMRINCIPIKVNPKTRESRLIPSIPAYIWRSILIILRAYVTYKPLRTFLYSAVPLALFGLVICLRFMYYFLFHDGSGHIQSLILAAILLIISFSMVVLGILADLISTNRKLIQETIFLQRKQQYYERRNNVGKSRQLTEANISNHEEILHI